MLKHEAVIYSSFQYWNVVLNTNSHLIDCYRQDVDAEISGRDNLNTFALVEAAYDAASSNGSVQPLWFSG